MKNKKNNEIAAADAAALNPNLAAAQPRKRGKKEKPAVVAAQQQMTIYEYEEKYVKRENAKGAAILLRLIVALIGVFFACCFFFVCKSIWEMNEYAGYGSIAVAAVLFICLYIVPVVKILKSDYFVTNVNYKTAAAAKSKNRKLRKKIAHKIVDVCNNVAGVGWYDSRTVEQLEKSLKKHDEEGIKQCLTELYNGSVKKSARDIIFKCSLKAAMYSALSQESKIDTLLVVTVNLQMIKDIVFLYGFRPSDTKLVKIFGAVVRNALVAYGLGGLKIGNGIARTVGDAAKGIPVLGSIISVLVDSSVQGLANGTLSAIIGYQTIKYLSHEYKLQNILDGIDVAETEEELAETCEDIEKELRKNKGKRPAPAV
ncbi:MAG: YcjF family protein [Clostridia bacterium]|nr:YcjF family protein [Clostridia bacterium]